MIRRKLYIATAIIASVAITACSDMTAPKKVAPSGLPGAATLAPPRVAVADHEGNREHVAVVATIRGRGTAEMTEPGRIRGKTVFFAGPKGIKLLADGSATGHFTCIDVVGLSTGPGNINGEATSWSMEGDVVVVNFVGTLSPIPGGPQFPPKGNVPFTVKIQKFGGAAVGHWTMQIGDVVYCVETLTSGRIAIYRKDDDRED
jgi:hypothetical protein